MKRCLIVAILIACAATPAAAQDKRGIVWNDRPSIVFGEDINIDLRARAQFDWRRYDPEVNAADLRRENRAIRPERRPDPPLRLGDRARSR